MNWPTAHQQQPTLQQNLPKTDANLTASRPPARAPLRTSHKKGRGPLDQPKRRHCADRVRRDDVEPIDCPLKHKRFEAKRAATSVMLCAMVKAVTVMATRFQPRTRITSTSTNDK